MLSFYYLILRLASLNFFFSLIVMVLVVPLLDLADLILAFAIDFNLLDGAGFASRLLRFKKVMI